jgi:hypothetical protein
METTKATITILNDLIEINNDRIKGYEKAIGELKDGDQDLKALFSGMIDDSREARNALGVEVQVLGADMEPADTGHNRHTVLSNCEFGEDAAQKAYKIALEDEHLPAYLRQMIEQQKQKFKGSHDEIKALRNQEKK